MRFPQMRPISKSRQVTSVFGGYNHNPVIGDGEWWDMENMTSDHYPLLSPDLGVKSEDLDYGIYGAVSNNGLCYVRQGSFAEPPVFVIHRETKQITKDIGLKAAEGNNLVAMGAYVIVLPDKKWVNTADGTWGNIEYTANVSRIYARMCTKDGENLGAASVGPKPESANDGDRWIDRSVFPPIIKRWSSDAKLWIEEKGYIKICIKPGTEGKLDGFEGEVKFDFKVNGKVVADGTLGDVKAGDVLEADPVSWVYNGPGNGYIYIEKNPVLEKIVTDSDKSQSIVIPGIVGNGSNLKWVDFAFRNGYTWGRSVPDMDFVIESGNRLWGCKFGETETSGFVNEIYASKLGDFKSWYSFKGTSADSYAASVGADGPFTGAISYNGRPVFFKENCMIQVYGAYPAQYQVNTIECKGIQFGCAESAAVVNNRLYYWSRDGVCMYDGSLPVTISAPLGNLALPSAIGGGADDKYYVMPKGGRQAFVFDTRRSLWHTVDAHGTGTASCCEHDNDLYIFLVNGVNGADPYPYTTVNRMRGKGLAVNSEPEEIAPVNWMVESGDIGLTTPDAKYISRLDVRMSLAEGSEVTFSVKYDFEEEWIHLATMTGTSLRSFDVPIRPKRCDTMRLRIEGTGDANIYSITKIIEQGGDVH